MIVTKSGPDTSAGITATSAQNDRDIASAPAVASLPQPENGHARPLMRTRKGEIVADAKWPGMYRISWRDGRLSGMVNYTRAADALRQAS